MQFSISLPLDALLMLAFYLLLMTYVIFSLVFFYHWNAYALSYQVTKLTYLVYIGLSLPLLATMVLMLTIY